MKREFVSIFIVSCLLVCFVYTKTFFKHFLDCNYSYTIPSDEYYDEQWAIEKVELDKAWDIYTGSNAVKVGIIDSGIDADHEDLEGNISFSLAHYFGNDNINPLTDGVGHGSLVAGVIGAKGDNDVGVSGACWDVGLVSLSIATQSPYLIYVPGINEAIAYASNQNNPIPLLNLSAGVALSKLSEHVDDVIDFFDEFYDIMDTYSGLLICAAGNGQNINPLSPSGKDIDNFSNTIFPASYSRSNMIVVGNSDFNDDKASTSNYGPNKVNLFAPGENIVTTNNHGYYTNNINSNDPNNWPVSGTSFSTPLVAGTAALLKSIDPTITSAQIKAAILNNVDVVENLYDLCSSHGRLNAYKAALSILPSLIPNDVGISFNSNINYQKFIKMNCTSGHYSLLINNSVPCRITIYKKYTNAPLIQQSFFSNGSQSINFLSETDQTIFIRVENLGSNNGDISMSATFQNHTYNSSYSYFNQLYHRAYCTCGSYVLLPHIVYVEHEFDTTGICAICSAIVPIGNGIFSIDNPEINNSMSVFKMIDKQIIQCYYWGRMMII